MKAKELAQILGESTEELLKLLEVVGLDISNKENSEVDAMNEKKLALRYNIKYPFKKSGSKPKTKTVPSVHMSLLNNKPTQRPSSPAQKPLTPRVNKPGVIDKQTSGKSVGTQSGAKEQSSQKRVETPNTSTYQTRDQRQNVVNRPGSTTRPMDGGYTKRPVGPSNPQTPRTFNPNASNQGNSYNRGYNNNNSNGSYNQGNTRGYNSGYNNGYNKPGFNKPARPVTPKPVVKPVVPEKKKIVNVEQKINYIDEVATARIDVDEKFLDKYDSLVEPVDAVEKIVHKKVAAVKSTKLAKQQKNDQTFTQADVKVRRKKNINNKTRSNANLNREKRSSSVAQELVEDHVLYYEEGMTVTDIANGLNISVTELVKKLFVGMGIMANATQPLDKDTTELVCVEYGYEVKDKQITDLTRFDEMVVEDSESDLVSRPPVVTIMGHVDHGKTTLLDTIRSSHVVKGEAGGITQRIGAYQVKKNDRFITFIDTPGHAAFTEMRARGAQITDIVVLVVAADDGVMPQTVEAIEHAKAAGVPIIVAINKMDKPGANPDRVKQELGQYNLIPEDWGGDTIFVPLSALTGKGVDDLLENILLVSDVHEYKANPNRLGIGTVLEARLDKGRGPVATLLVQNGTLKVGDVIVIGTTYGKIRAMQDELGRIVVSAGPSKPVEVTGLAEVPFAGEKFMVLTDEKQARGIAVARSQNKQREENAQKALALSEVFKNQESTDIKTLNLIIKCDIQGSVEAVKNLLEKIQIEGVQINIIGARVGGINDNDISLAIASQAILIGFNIRPTAQITDLAKDKGVEIRLYDIIYKLQEDIEKAAKGLLDPIFAEKVTGQAEVKNIFKISKVGTVAGSFVTSGSIVRNGSVRVIRDSIVVYTGKLMGLRRVKDDVKEVKEGFECGISIENFNDIKVGDVIECFIMEEQERE